MFEGIPLTDFSAPGLLAVVVLMILTGVLVPLRTYKQKAEECDRWRMAFETEREARQTSDAQTTKLLETQQTSHAIIVSIFDIIKDIRNSGDRNVAS